MSAADDAGPELEVLAARSGGGIAPDVYLEFLQALPPAIVATDAEGIITFWNLGAERLYGWRASEVLGLSIVEVLVPPSGPLDMEGFARRIARGEDADVDRTFTDSAGRLVDVHLLRSPVHDAEGVVVGYIGIGQDVTRQRAAERAAEAASERLRLALEGGRLGTWSWDAATGSTTWDARMEEIFGLAPGTFGGTFEHWIALLPESDRAATMHGFRDALATRGEYRLDHRVVWPDGSEHWTSGSGKILLDENGAVLGAFGCTMDVTDRVEAERAVARARDAAVQAAARERLQRERLEFLARVNDILVGSTSRREVIDRVARAAVPQLGEWCVVLLADHQREEPEIAIGHSDPAMAELAFELRARFRFDPSAPAGIGRVITSGVPELYPLVTVELLERLGVDDRFRDRIQALGARSVITVPLAGPRGPIGALQLIATAPDRTFDGDDLSLATALAGRVASSLEIRRLDHAQRHIAHTLQQSLLPGHLPAIAGIDLAVRYWAAGDATEVGGDFYDVFILDDERFVVVVGDVCGSGPEAAAVTALARHNIRANAWRGDGPIAVLAHLNEAILRTRSDTFCTVAYAVGRRERDGLHLAAVSGGHPLPIIVRCDGSSEQLGRPGTLIGALHEINHHLVETVIRVGERVVFYTDGAVDLPAPDGLSADEFAELVVEASSEAPTSAEGDVEAISSVLAARLPFASRVDDVALLVLHPVTT